MVEHDGHIGVLLDLLDELGIADDTVVVYTTDNGAEVMTWPDGGMAPFRGEKNTPYEGGYRVPLAVRWPELIEGGRIVNGIVSLEDLVPTLMAAVGEPDIKEKLKKGHKIGDTTYKVHLDGYNFLPYVTGESDEWPRKEFFYFTDDGDLAAIRWNNWKVLFLEQRAHGWEVWADPMVPLRMPRLYNLRSDPFERAENEAIGYAQWFFDRMFAFVPAQTIVKEFMQTFVEFPPRQKPASFSIEQADEQITQALTGGR
jgi:arylsulfatase